MLELDLTIGRILRLVDAEMVRERQLVVAKPCDQQLVRSRGSRLKVAVRPEDPALQICADCSTKVKSSQVLRPQ